MSHCQGHRNIRPRNRFIVCGLASIGLGLLTLGPAHPQTARLIAQNTFPSVVLIVTEDTYGQPRSMASGFFIRDGIVATNLHVIEGAAGGYVKLVGKPSKHSIAGIVGLDGRRDLALIK